MEPSAQPSYCVDEASYCADERRCRFAIRSGERVAILSLSRGQAACGALLRALDTPALRPAWESEVVYAQGSPERGEPVAYDQGVLYLRPPDPFAWLDGVLERASGLGAANHGVAYYAAAPR